MEAQRILSKYLKASAYLSVLIPQSNVVINGFGLLSTMFVYNDAVGHVTRFLPPDWLLLHIVVSHGTTGIVNLFSFPRISPMAAEVM